MERKEHAQWRSTFPGGRVPQADLYARAFNNRGTHTQHFLIVGLIPGISQHIEWSIKEICAQFLPNRLLSDALINEMKRYTLYKFLKRISKDMEPDSLRDHIKVAVRESAKADEYRNFLAHVSLYPTRNEKGENCLTAVRWKSEKQIQSMLSISELRDILFLHVELDFYFGQVLLHMLAGDAENLDNLVPLDELWQPGIAGFGSRQYARAIDFEYPDPS